MPDQHFDPSAQMSANEKRQLRLRLWQNVPASTQLLYLMATNGAITSQEGAVRLGCALQTARNALSKLVRQGRAAVARGEGRSEFAAYTITPKGCVAVESIVAPPTLGEVDDEESELMHEEHEAAQRRASIEVNIDRALRRVIPCSVFDLGRCIAVGARA